MGVLYSPNTALFQLHMHQNWEHHGNGLAFEGVREYFLKERVVLALGFCDKRHVMGLLKYFIGRLLGGYFWPI